MAKTNCNLMVSFVNLNVRLVVSFENDFEIGVLKSLNSATVWSICKPRSSWFVPMYREGKLIPPWYL